MVSELLEVAQLPQGHGARLRVGDLDADGRLARDGRLDSHMAGGEVHRDVVGEGGDSSNADAGSELDFVARDRRSGGDFDDVGLDPKLLERAFERLDVRLHFLRGALRTGLGLGQESDRWEIVALLRCRLLGNAQSPLGVSGARDQLGLLSLGRGFLGFIGHAHGGTFWPARSSRRRLGKARVVPSLPERLPERPQGRVGAQNHSHHAERADSDELGRPEERIERPSHDGAEIAAGGRGDLRVEVIATKVSGEGTDHRHEDEEHTPREAAQLQTMPTREKCDTEKREHDGDRPRAAPEKKREEAAQSGTENPGIAEGKGHHHDHGGGKSRDTERVGRPMG